MDIKKTSSRITNLFSEKRADQDGHKKDQGRRCDSWQQAVHLCLMDVKNLMSLQHLSHRSHQGQQNWAMSTIDAGNVFIQADNDEQILMLLPFEVAEHMVRVNPTLYWPYITYSKKGFLCCM